ncbi:hypothetical protein ACLMJK_006530 [Lecanora helva]
MSEETFHTTREDLRKPESEVSKKTGGSIPKDSEVAQTMSHIDQNSKPKSEIIAERQANLPLPDQPPAASDFNSSDERTVNVGSGRVEDDVSYGGGSDSLRGPVTSESGVRTDGDSFGKNASAPGAVGREGHDNLGGLPKDALKK